MAKHNKQDKPGFYMKNPKLGEVAMRMGDRPDPAMREESILSKIKKAGRTALQLGKEVGAQLIDLTTSDPGNTKYQPGFNDYYKTLENRIRVKDFENRVFDQGRDLVRRGKTYFSLADILDDSGAGLFKEDKRENYGTNTSSKNSVFKIFNSNSIF